MKLGDYFETKTRESGEAFVTLKDGSPEWLLDAICEAHNGTFPSDWAYVECKAAFDAIDDGADLSDADTLAEHADGRVDVYTKALFAWAAEHCLTSLYSDAEEEAKDLVGEDATTEDRFKAIQYCAIQRIAATMAEACKEHGEDEDEDEDDDADGA
jgi:hypothetical protein